MLVYAATPGQFDQAFHHWADQEMREHRLRIKAVFDQFMVDEIAQSFHTQTGLYCFTYPDWQLAFGQWRDHAIRDHDLDTFNRIKQ